MTINRDSKEWSEAFDQAFKMTSKIYSNQSDARAQAVSIADSVIATNSFESPCNCNNPYCQV